MPKRNLLLIVSFIVLFYLFYSAMDETADSVLSGSPVDQNFDYYMSVIDSTRFSADGNSLYRLQAERIQHYPQPELTSIEMPRLIFYVDEAGPWFLSAAYGTIQQDAQRAEDKLELSENVIVQHTDNRGETHNIYTEALTIYLDSRILTTDQDVLMESSNREISSQGMTADLFGKHLTFLGNVQGRYD
jgi:lipopolysaccharide export system protein LptC